MNIEAEKIHTALKNHIRGKRLQGTVHSVFKHVVNILAADKNETHIISLVAKTEEIYPWSVILPMDSMEFMPLSIGEDITIEKDALYAKTLTIHLKSANAYDTLLPDYAPDKNVLQHMDYVKALLTQEEKKILPENPIGAKTAEVLQERLGQAKAAFLDNDRERFCYALSGLIGLGQGLTPSGDDYLTSCMALIKMPKSPLNELNYLCPYITNRAFSKTNLLSYSYLKRASMGQVRGNLIELIHSILSGENMDGAFLKMMTIGSSSGRDLTGGVLFGFELIMLAGKGNSIQ